MDGKLWAPVYVRLLDNKPVEFSLDAVPFHQVYGMKFDIREVMGRLE